jgi:hypothetical protein
MIYSVDGADVFGTFIFPNESLFERPVLADCVEEVGGPNVWDVARNQGARGFVCSQAGIGAGSGISFASFRRFWAVAASRNSS